MRSTTLVPILFLGGVFAEATAQPRYRITDLGVPAGYAFSEAFGVNESGQVVGSAVQFFPGGGNIRHAILWDGGSITDMGTLPGGRWATAYRINNTGTIVGWSDYSPDGFNSYYYGFAYDIASGGMSGLVTVPTGGPYYNTVARCINDAGSIGGSAVCSASPTIIAGGVVWSGGGFTCIPAGDGNSNTFGINSAGHVTVKLPTSDGFNLWYHAFYSDGGALVDLATFSGPTGYSEGRDINESDQIVGWAENRVVGYSHAFLWSSGVMLDLDDRGPAIQSLSQALALNNLGQVVGSGNILGHLHWDAILWDSGTQYPLIDLLPPGSGWDLLEARDISDSGYIVGAGTNSASAGSSRAFLMTPICGDANLDGLVDLSDLATLLSHFGTSAGATLADGDFDGDGDVDLGDLAFLLAHFGLSCP